ncbi:MAG: hypothetical protein ACRDSR_14260 [Pseudonocardiaceae bacterium]
MGSYPRYDTPLDEAGYATEEVCHHAQIDRGLSYPARALYLCKRNNAWMG